MNETNKVKQVASQAVKEVILQDLKADTTQVVKEVETKIPKSVGAKDSNPKANQEVRYSYGVGRRKASTARAKYYPSANPIQVFINKKPLSTYLHQFYAQVIEIALVNINITTGELQIFVRGGGSSGQAEAIRLAIAKSIITYNPEIKPAIRLLGYNTTDTRKVLPKRPGLRKARKREQWSKR